MFRYALEERARQKAQKQALTAKKQQEKREAKHARKAERKRWGPLQRSRATQQRLNFA